MNNEPWYSVKCVFAHDRLAEKEGTTFYEERVVVLYATSLDDAILRGEAEAHNYASMNSSARYTGFINTYHLPAEELTDKTEVYSLMRESNLDVEAFLDRYHDDGTERTQHYEPSPS